MLMRMSLLNLSGTVEVTLHQATFLLGCYTKNSQIEMTARLEEIVHEIEEIWEFKHIQFFTFPLHQPLIQKQLHESGVSNLKTSFTIFQPYKR